ncbi:hypothetical protein Tco_1184294 [Tanacetum coccineum]
MLHSLQQPGHQVPPEGSSSHALHWLWGPKGRTKSYVFQTSEHELLQTVREFNTCKKKESQSVSSHVLKMKSYIDNLEPTRSPVGQNLGSGLILLHDEIAAKKDANTCTSCQYEQEGFKKPNELNDKSCKGQSRYLDKRHGIWTWNAEGQDKSKAVTA